MYIKYNCIKLRIRDEQWHKWTHLWAAVIEAAVPVVIVDGMYWAVDQ